MHTFIAHARQRRLAIATSAVLVLMVIHGATSAVLVLMAIHGAAPATAGGGIGGSADRQATANLLGGGAIPGSIENRGTLPLYTSHSVEMEKISGVAQATLPTIGFETVDGMLGDGDEVYLNTGQLADFYRFSTKAAKMTYTITAASTNFPVASTLYMLDPKQPGYVALQETKVFRQEPAQYSATLPAGRYAIQINSASMDMQNGRYGLALTRAADPGDALASVAGGTKLGGSTGDEVYLQRRGIQSDGVRYQLQGTKIGAGVEI
jgi:hypothetical protein